MAHARAPIRPAASDRRGPSRRRHRFGPGTAVALTGAALAVLPFVAAVGGAPSESVGDPAGGAGLAGAPGSVASPDPPGAAATTPSPQALLLEVARELDAERSRRAVQSLLDHADQAVLEELLAALAPGGDVLFQRVIAQALAGREAPPPQEFAEPLLGLLPTADDPLLSDLAAALGRFRSTAVPRRLIAVARDAAVPVPQRCAAIRALAFHRSQATVGHLVRLLDPVQPEAVTRAAADALVTLTGTGRAATSVAQWQAWWARHQELVPARWYALLLDNHARIAGDRRQEIQGLRGRLLEAHRRLYRTTAEEEQEALLVDLLGDDSIALRQLAIDLMWQRLSDMQPFAQPLRRALLGALDDSSAAIRRGAAGLLRDLKDEPGADAMARHLIDAGEQDPDVLRVYLVVMAAQPRAGSIEPAIRLLADPALRNEAAGVLVSLAQQDALGPDLKIELRARLRRQLAPDTLPAPKVIELLGYVGDEDDWRRIEQWIDSDQDKIKEAAALAWARSDRSLQLLAERAGDVRIQPIVLVFAERRGFRPETLGALLKHPPEQDQARQVWERALIAMAGRVTPQALLEADAALAQDAPADDPRARHLRRRMLTEAVKRALPENGNGPQSPLPVDVDTTAQLLLRRAELALVGGEPKAALEDLGLITERKWPLEADRRDRHDTLSIRARLADGDADGALTIAERVIGRVRRQPGDTSQQAAALVSPFLDAATRHIEANQAPRARDILRRVTELMGKDLPVALAERLAQLMERTGRSSPANGAPPSNAPGPPDARQPGAAQPDSGAPAPPRERDMPDAPPGG